MNTLLLNPNTWDLLLDSSGDIALASNPYSIAQDVASAAKLFSGELFYDQSKGIPYFQDILSHNPSAGFLAAQYDAAALTVPEVVQAKTISLYNSNRTVTGQIEIIDLTGTAQNVQF